jgi:hypothetical protein
MSFAMPSDEFRRYAESRTMPGGGEIDRIFHMMLWIVPE